MDLLIIVIVLLLLFGGGVSREASRSGSDQVAIVAGSNRSYSFLTTA
jgi:hypothetical protein